jgi:hypothetical protein
MEEEEEDDDDDECSYTRVTEHVSTQTHNRVRGNGSIPHLIETQLYKNLF